MSNTIVCDVKVAPGANQYYGQLVVSNIAYSDRSSVSVTKFLGVEFKSPASVTKEDFYGSLNPWKAITADITSRKIDSSTFVITAKLNIDGGHTFSASDTLTFGINGDLEKDQQVYTTSFALGADELPDSSGTVNINVASTPDPALKSNEQSVNFSEGQQVTGVQVPLGETTSVKLPAGTFAVTVDDLATSDETVVATAHVSPSSVTVKTGETNDVKVTYGDVKTYSAIDVTVGDVSRLENEDFHVTVVDTNSGKTLAEFSSPGDYTTSLRRLPPSGTAVVSVDPLTLNNVEYSFDPKSTELSASLFKISFAQADVKTKEIDTSSFVTLPIVVDTSLTLNSTIPVSLSSDTLNYTQTVDAMAGSTAFSVPVGPGQYTVDAPGFIQKGTVYFVNTVASLAVAADGSTALQLSVLPGPSLSVRGFPSFLSFGGCADLTPGNQADFVAARASSVFKYAGTGGDGNPSEFLADDSATRLTLALARNVEAKLDDGNPVLPIMISYTCNLSGGDPESRLQDSNSLAHSFANFILSLNLAAAAIDDQHPVPAGYIVNPDFLGACQQHPLAPSYT